MSLIPIDGNRIIFWHQKSSFLHTVGFWPVNWQCALSGAVEFEMDLKNIRLKMWVPKQLRSLPSEIHFKLEKGSI